MRRTTAVLGALVVLTLWGSAQPGGADSSSAVTGILPLPIMYYTPETGLAFGAAVMHFSRPPIEHAKPTVFTGIAIYTTKRQFTGELDWDIYRSDEDYRVVGVLSGVRYPQVLYGVGNETPESQKESYTVTAYRLSGDLLRRMTPELRLGISMYAETRSFSGLKTGGLIATGIVPGSDGGNTIGLGVVSTWDSRDHLFWPRKGSFHQVQWRAADKAIGSSRNFTRTVVDLRTYVPVSGEIVMAFQVYTMITIGNVPFHKMAELGGQNMMRGYYQGRFLDKVLSAVQGEIRIPFTERLIGTAFGGLGTVAPTLATLSASHIKPSLGAGIRYVYDPRERLVLRLDVGYGKGSSGMYITANEAF